MAGGKLARIENVFAFRHVRCFYAFVGNSILAGVVFTFSSLLLSLAALAQDEPSDGGEPSGSTTMYVSNSGIVSFHFSGDGYTYSTTGVGMVPNSFGIIDPNGVLISNVNLRTTMGPGPGGQCATTVSGTGTYVSLSSGLDSYPSVYTTNGSTTSTSNGSLYATSGSGQEDWAEGGVWAGWDVVFDGTYSFYAATPGNYTFTWTPCENYVEDAIPPEEGGQNQGPLLGTILKSGTIYLDTFVLPNGTQLPSGTLTVTKNVGGASGVTLTWTITPPGH